MYTAVLSVLLLVFPASTKELLTNGGFEDSSHWHCTHIHCTLSPDSVAGQHSLRVSQRHHDTEGPAQDLTTVKRGGRYTASVYVKLMNDEAHVLGQSVMFNIQFVFKDKTSDMYLPMAHMPLVRSSDGWVHLVGDFVVPEKDIQLSRVKIFGPHPSVDYLVDSATVTQLPPLDPHWKDGTYRVIQAVRKSNIHLSITLENGLDPQKVTIKIDQMKHGFPFGTAVNSNLYLHGTEPRYNDFINKHFNWAVLENNLKWKANAPRANTSFYDGPVDTIKELRSHGIKVRGHCLVWSSETFLPTWVRTLRGDDLRRAVIHRIDEAMKRTHGLVEHWDVNNENLHGQWFQEVLQDRDYNLELFRIAHQADSGVKLFLNDNKVVARGANVQAYLAQATEFKNAHVGLYGIGAQTHFRDMTAPDPYLIKNHLDTLAKTGLPIWITELDLYHPDEKTRADWYETALRSMFGHPAVEGIMIWGFWSKKQWRGEPASLVSGDNFRINSAGQRFLHLLEHDWMTHAERNVTDTGAQFSVHGFHGDYDVTVLYNGHEVHQARQTFTLGKNDTHINIHVPKLGANIIG
ncbi:anti-sigma-I factor RsgI6-like [Haliotis cracherodii]|uniref:anti-sigma-I factor RsgI6-like n=1 Tax=Haliotis cracherodii TaxID=6455 RepID=UPI0039E7429E